MNSTNSSIIAVDTPTPAEQPTAAEQVQEELGKAGVSIREMEEVTNSSRPNVQSDATSRQENRVQNDMERTENGYREAGNTENGGVTTDFGENGMMRIENQGINPPNSMKSEDVAEQQEKKNKK